MIKFEKLEKTKKDLYDLGYILTCPDNVGSDEKLPLIVFLHGAGERGDNLELLKVYCVPKLFTQNQEYNGIRAYTLSPQCPHNTTWIDYKNELVNLIDKTVKENNIDEKIKILKIYKKRD